MIIKLLLTSFISVPNYLVTTNIYKNEQASLSRVAYDLSTLLEDNLGNITDTSINVLETILIKKYNVDVNQIELQNLSYGDVNVVAKKDSLDYFGSKYITFNINLTLLGTKISTKNLYVNAYNSIQKDSQKLTIKYESNFGKNIFTEYFKNIEFEWWALTYDNSKSKEEERHRGHNNTGAKVLNMIDDERKTVDFTKKEAIV